MLIRFGVSNHLSLKDYQEVSLVASKLKDIDTGLIDLSFSKPDAAGVPQTPSRMRLVPVVALYGANASGKSTVLNALDFFVKFVALSHARGEADDGTPYHPFLLDDESRTNPSHYDIDIALDGVRYHYGYSLDGKRVLSEWLYSYPIGTLRQTRSVLLHRDVNNEEEFYFGKGLKGENKQISRLTRPNSLFLSAAAQNSHDQLTPIYKFLTNKIARRTVQQHNSIQVARQLINYFKEDEERRISALRFLRAADIGVSGIDFTSVPYEGKVKAILKDLGSLMSRHFEKDAPEFDMEQPMVDLMHVGFEGKSYPIKMDAESAGTVSLLELLGPALTRLSTGGVLVVDELNTTIHPLVTRELIRLFSDPVTNPGHAQLLFSTHDTNILAGRILRRDQIWFAEKDVAGATHIYSMAEIKVRAGDNLEAGYLAGRFGAIPYFGTQDFREGNDFTERK